MRGSVHHALTVGQCMRTTRGSPAPQFLPVATRKNALLRRVRHGSPVDSLSQSMTSPAARRRSCVAIWQHANQAVYSGGRHSASSHHTGGSPDVTVSHVNIPSPCPSSSTYTGGSPRLYRAVP